jgi:hypothetical protein
MDIGPCNVVEVDRRFRGVCCLQQQGETSICSNETTRRSISKGCHFHTCRRENLKHHLLQLTGNSKYRLL